MDRDPQSARPDDPTGPTLTGTGPAWPTLPEPLPPGMAWINGRAFPAVWRELLAFSRGGLLAVAKDFPQMRPGRPWQHRPDPDTDADIEQAIAAKLHLALRALPLLAEAEVVLIEPPLADLIPDWEEDEAEARYAATGQLSHSPLFLDFESADGLPAAWHAETWPLPLHLRGSLCWQAEEMLCVVPFGSVGGVHPWGGSDYHAWARWLFLQEELEQWPMPGPGDFLARATGEVLSWVDAEQDSVCAHQGALAYNLCSRTLRVLQLLENLGGELVEPRLERPLRRRAVREGQRIARVPARFPTVAADQPPEAAVAAAQDAAPCVVPKTHARLEQAHALWHEALAAYHDPELFVTKLNALIQALRTVTWVLQKEFGNSDEFKSWYTPWQGVLKADMRLSWALEVRNQVEHQGDLETSSVAHVRVIAGGWSAPVAELDVDPTADAAEIVRRVQLIGLPEPVRKDGVVEVERRWTLPELPGDEVLEVLAHCWGVLARVVAAGHQARGQTMDDCAFSAEPACGAEPLPPHPSGRWPCMVASREARTGRRNLATGVPYELEVSTLQRPPPFDERRARERYRMDEWQAAPAEEDLAARGAAFHQFGRHVLVADRYHLPIAWLLREGARVAQTVMHPEDQRDKAMMMHRLAVEADRMGADELMFTTEVWEAPLVGSDDPRFGLRPGERDDRREALVTYAMARGRPCQTWLSGFVRDPDGAILLEEVEHHVGEPQPFLQPLLAVWSEWPDEA
jgi:hypothetical protein